MDDYCYAKMATSCQRESERESAPPTSSKSPTEMKIKTEDEEVRQLIGHHEDFPSQPRGVSSTLKQEMLLYPPMKEEEEDIWITQEDECPLGLQGGDLTKLPLTIVSVKTEDDEEKPQVDNLLAPLSDSEAEDEVEETLSNDTDCEGDMRTHTGNKQTGKKSLDCSVCGTRCAKKSHLTEHMRTHTGEKPFMCSVCGKSFTYRGNLTQHIRTHKGEKPFNCSVCSKSFSLKAHLTQHMRTHTGERPFICSVCGKRCTNKSHVTEHMRTHTGEKPFICSVCGKSFLQKSHLTEHIRTHTGEKPFICSVCGKSFTRKCNLTQHTRTHTGEKPFNCSDCGKSFSQNSTLTQHMKLHTGEKI